MDYWTDFAFNVIMARFNISEVPRDEWELRTLFTNVFQHLVGTRVLQEHEGQSGTDPTDTSAADIALLQIMNRMYEERPDWRECWNNDAPRALQIETSSMSQPSTSFSSQPLTSSSIHSPMTLSSEQSTSPPSEPPAESSARQHIRQLWFTCSICGRAFSCKHDLQNHVRTHTGERPYKCVKCNQAFTCSHHLKIDFSVHTGEKQYLCKRCYWQFVQVGNLLWPLRSHNIENSHPCEFCNATFETTAELKTYTCTHKELEVPPREASELTENDRGRIATVPSNIASMTSTITSATTTITLATETECVYMCGVCELTFKTTIDLKIHEYTHKRRKTFPVKAFIPTINNCSQITTMTPIITLATTTFTSTTATFVASTSTTTTIDTATTAVKPTASTLWSSDQVVQAHLVQQPNFVQQTYPVEELNPVRQTHPVRQPPPPAHLQPPRPAHMRRRPTVIWKNPVYSLQYPYPQQTQSLNLSVNTSRSNANCEYIVHRTSRRPIYGPPM